MSKKIFVLDRYINKYYSISGVSDEILEEVEAWSKFVFEYEEKWRKKMSVGTYLGFEVETDLRWAFVRPLEHKELEYFEEQQAMVIKEKYPIFKKDFRAAFKWSIPVTARYQIFTRQTYFYFHSEERYVFGDFVPKFQQKIGSAVFFFQVWARDIIRLSHQADWMLDGDGRQLRARSLRPFPSVGIEEVLMQGLEWRDIEKLKDHSWKLKPSLAFEVDTYRLELEKFPAKGQKIEIKWQEIYAMVTGLNINTGEVVVRTKEWWRYRLLLEEIIWSQEEKQKLVDQRKKTYDRPKRYKNKQKERSTPTPTKWE
jgi:hypothetical protein